MMWLRSPSTSIPDFDPVNLLVPSFNLHISVSFTVACILKCPKLVVGGWGWGAQVGARTHNNAFFQSAGQELECGSLFKENMEIDRHLFFSPSQLGQVQLKK